MTSVKDIAGCGITAASFNCTAMAAQQFDLIWPSDGSVRGPGERKKHGMRKLPPNANCSFRKLVKFYGSSTAWAVPKKPRCSKHPATFASSDHCMLSLYATQWSLGHGMGWGWIGSTKYQRHHCLDWGSFSSLKWKLMLTSVSLTNLHIEPSGTQWRERPLQPWLDCAGGHPYCQTHRIKKNIYIYLYIYINTNIDIDISF